MMFSDDQEKDLQPSEKKTEVGTQKPHQEVWINTHLRDVPLTPACKALGVRWWDQSLKHRISEPAGKDWLDSSLWNGLGGAALWTGILYCLLKALNSMCCGQQLTHLGHPRPRAFPRCSGKNWGKEKGERNSTEGTLNWVRKMNSLAH